MKHTTTGFWLLGYGAVGLAVGGAAAFMGIFALIPAAIGAVGFACFAARATASWRSAVVGVFFMEAGLVCAAAIYGAIMPSEVALEWELLLVAIVSGSVLGTTVLPLSLVIAIVTDRRRSAARRLACPGCGYSRVGLSGDVCPECGSTPAEVDARARKPLERYLFDPARRD